MRFPRNLVKRKMSLGPYLLLTAPSMWKLLGTSGGYEKASSNRSIRHDCPTLQGRLFPCVSHLPM